MENARQRHTTIKTNNFLGTLPGRTQSGERASCCDSLHCSEEGTGSQLGFAASFPTARLGNQAKKLIWPPASAGTTGVARSGSSEAVASAISSSACSSSSALACFSSLGVYPSSPILAGASISKTAVSSEFNGGALTTGIARIPVIGLISIFAPRSSTSHARAIGCESPNFNLPIIFCPISGHSHSFLSDIRTLPASDAPAPSSTPSERSPLIADLRTAIRVGHLNRLQPLRVPGNIEKRRGLDRARTVRPDREVGLAGVGHGNCTLVGDDRRPGV